MIDPSPPSPPALDWDAAVARLRGRRDLLIDIARLFLQDVDQQLAQIQQASSQRDARKVHRLLHQLKGSLSWFGAHSVHGTMGRFGCDKDALPTDVHACVDQLVCEVQCLKQALAEQVRAA